MLPNSTFTVPYIIILPYLSKVQYLIFFCKNLQILSKQCFQISDSSTDLFVVFRKEESPLYKGHCIKCFSLVRINACVTFCFFFQQHDCESSLGDDTSEVAEFRYFLDEVSSYLNSMGLFDQIFLCIFEVYIQSNLFFLV